MTNNYTLGIDVSVWQDSNYTTTRPDFNKAYDNGARFAIIRGAFGPSLDEDLIYNYGASKAAGLYRGIYHFLDYRTVIGLTAEQAFNKMASDARAVTVALGADKPELGFFADWERPSSEWPALPDYNVSIAALRGFYSTVDAYMGSANKNGIYGNRVTIDNITPVPDDILKRPLWIAAWPTLTTPLEEAIMTTTFLPNTTPFSKWTFWQFSSKGSGTAYGMESGYVDLDVFNGSLDDLKAYAGGEVTAPTDLEERVAKLEKTVAAHSNRIVELLEDRDAMLIRLDNYAAQFSELSSKVTANSNSIANINKKLEAMKAALA